MEKMEVVKLDYDEDYVIIHADSVTIGNNENATVTRSIRHADHPIKIVSDGKIEILFWIYSLANSARLFLFFAMGGYMDYRKEWEKLLDFIYIPQWECFGEFIGHGLSDSGIVYEGYDTGNGIIYVNATSGELLGEWKWYASRIILMYGVIEKRDLL